jgi:hypothetical protein
VYSTYDVAPVLLQELPPDLAVQLDGAGADWLALRTTARPGTEAGTEPDSQPDTQPDSQPDSQPDTEPGVQPETELGTEPEPQSAAPGPPVALEQEIVPGVILKGYGVQPAPTGVPVTQGPPAADVTLYWGLLGAWPPELGISLRPTAGGAFLPQAGGEAGAIVQVDAPAPRHGLLEGGEARLADSYRVPLGKGADGILLIVYEKTADGFRNLLELPLELARGE